MRPFVDSCDILADKNDTIDVNKIISIILNNQPGASFGTPVIEVDSVAVSSYKFVKGNIPTLNSVTYA